MCDKDPKETTNKEKTARCGCAQKESGYGSPCKKRICLPIMGLVGLAVVVSVAAKRKNRK